MFGIKGWQNLMLSEGPSMGLTRAIFGFALGCVFFITPIEGNAADFGPVEQDHQPQTIDDLRFSDSLNQNPFSINYRIENSSVLSPRGKFKLHSMLELEPVTANFGHSGLILDDDAIQGAQGFKVRRISTAIEGAHGTLTVGSDWTNFQDFLGFGDSEIGYLSVSQNALTADQISWKNSRGFSVALENELGLQTESNAFEDVYKSSPNLILSWNSPDATARGQYSFSALGRQLQLEGFDQTERDKDELGWGLNIAGGWRFGDLFAALSVTLGNSIDDFILGRFGNRSSTKTKPNTINTSESININPSLNYRLSENTNLHVAISRFDSRGESTAYGVDTLDTVHLGYTWNPWPSTRFGVEFIGKDVEGNSELSDSNEVNFAASKRF